MIYTSLQTMYRDMEAYVRITGQKLLIMNDILSGFWGYVTEDHKTIFQVHLLRVDDPEALSKLGSSNVASRNVAVEYINSLVTKDIITDTNFIDDLIKNWKDQMKDQLGPLITFDAIKEPKS